jgi:hypothetical protein
VKWLVVLCVVSSTVFADSSSLNLQLPNGAQNYQSDKFRAGDLDCSNAIGGTTNVEFGVTGIISSDAGVVQPDSKDIGVYARIVIPLDAPKERINCNTLYQLELQKKRLEVQQLQQELNNLRKLKNGFDN